MQWEMASMPVAAVSSGGKPSVSSGSQIATFGSRCGLSRPSFRPSRITINSGAPDLAARAGGGRDGDERSHLPVTRATPPSTAGYLLQRAGCVATGPRLGLTRAHPTGTPADGALPRPVAVDGLVAVNGVRNTFPSIISRRKAGPVATHPPR